MHELFDDIDDSDPLLFFLCVGQDAVVCRLQFIFHGFRFFFSRFFQVSEEFLQFFVVEQLGRFVVED